MGGYCYVASEALYYILGGREAGLTAKHWWVEGQHGKLIDATADQFEEGFAYSKGVASGFLTEEQSPRAVTIILRVGAAGITAVWTASASVRTCASAPLQKRLIIHARCCWHTRPTIEKLRAAVEALDQGDPEPFASLFAEDAEARREFGATPRPQEPGAVPGSFSSSLQDMLGESHSRRRSRSHASASSRE